MIICIFRPDAEDRTVEVAFSVGNLPGAGGEACQMKINDAILGIDLPEALVVVEGLLGLAGLREGFGEAEAIIPIPGGIEQSGAKGFDGGNGTIFLEFGVTSGVPLLAEQVAATVVGLGVGMSDGGEKYGDENQDGNEQRFPNDKVAPKNVHFRPIMMPLCPLRGEENPQGSCGSNVLQANYIVSRHDLVEGECGLGKGL